MFFESFVVFYINGRECYCIWEVIWVVGNNCVWMFEVEVKIEVVVVVYG